MMPVRTPREHRRPYLKSGVYALKNAVQTLGSRALPSKRTALGRELREWRESLLADLGGAEAVTTQQLALVDLAVRSKLLVDSVDAYVLSMPSPVNRQRRCLHPVVRERASLVAQLQSLLRDLGLDRKAREVTSLHDYLAEHSKKTEPVQPAAGGGGDDPRASSSTYECRRGAP